MKDHPTGRKPAGKNIRTVIYLSMCYSLTNMQLSKSRFFRARVGALWRQTRKIFYILILGCKLEYRARDVLAKVTTT